MSHKGEARPTTDDTPGDAWWGRLYDDDGTPDMGDGSAAGPGSGPAWDGDSLDEHYASAVAAVRRAPLPPPGEAADDVDDVADDVVSDDVVTDGVVSDHVVSHRVASDDVAAVDGVNADDVADEPRRAPDPHDTLVTRETDDSAEDTLRLRIRSTPAPQTPLRPNRLPPGWASREPGPGLPAPDPPAVIPRPAIPPDDLHGDHHRPGPQADVPVVTHVGDRPPTYEGEPTAWPVADPSRLDELVPDTVLDGAHYGRLTVRAASSRGGSARYRGRPRGDALLTARFGAGDDALLFAAVASSGRAIEDGHRLAWEACRAIAAAVGRSHARLAEDVRAARRGSLKSGLQRLTERADAHTQTSLHCLLFPVDPDCRTRVFFGLGSGGLFRLREGEWRDLGPDAAPDSVPGADADADGDSTRFRFRACIAQPDDALLLCSGGLAEPLRDEPELARRLARRWGPSQPPPGIAAFLADVQTRVKGYADDRTAVAVWEA